MSCSLLQTYSVLVFHVKQQHLPVPMHINIKGTFSRSLHLTGALHMTVLHCPESKTSHACAVQVYRSTIFMLCTILTSLSSTIISTGSIHQHCLIRLATWTTLPPPPSPSPPPAPPPLSNLQAIANLPNLGCRRRLMRRCCLVSPSQIFNPLESATTPTSASSCLQLCSLHRKSLLSLQATLHQQHLPTRLPARLQTHARQTPLPQMRCCPTKLCLAMVCTA